MSSTKIDQRLQKIQSLYRRRDYKKAYKEAVFVAKQSGDPEVHSLMVASLWEWIKEQFQRNQFADAKANIQELLRLRDIPTAIQAEFPPIFRVLGLNSLLPEELRQDTTLPEVQTELADLYLLKGNKTGDLLPETLKDADRVRVAFEKIEASQDEDALELLKSISFRSPLAEWRLFLRGLIDHYHGDDAKAEESWKRLSPNRPPARIAAKLKALVHEKPSEASSSSGGLLGGLFNMFRGKSDSTVSSKTELLETLRVLDDYMKRGKDKELLGRFQSGKSLFQKEMPLQFARLLQVIHQYIVRNASPTTVQQFIDRNLPLPLDPKGNRTLAILSEQIDDSKHRTPHWLAEPLVYWKKYAEEDIDRIESFSLQMKARAKAAVYEYLAKQAHDVFCCVREEADDEEDFHQMIDVPKALKEIEDWLEKAIACDPAYVPAYEHLGSFALEMLPREEREKPFQPRLAEINERLLQHVPDAKEPLTYLFEYNLNAKNMDAAKSYYNRLRELDPLSRETLVRRNRICLAQVREGLKQRDYDQADAAFRELENGPPLESLYYRYNVFPLALGYVSEVLRGGDSGAGDYFAVAGRLGIEKRLPLIFAILAEGQEIGLPKKTLEPLQEEWSKTISGRCHGNTAGVLGDLAYNVLIVPERYPIAQKKLAWEACDFVNRAGQVKWNCEKDLFCACNLLWYLAVEQQKDEYEKTYRNLVKKLLKLFPNLPLALFFNAETYWLETGWYRHRLANKTREMYQEFLKRAGSLRNDTVYQYFIGVAERKITEIDDPFQRFGSNYLDDDDDWDDDWDDDDDDDDDESGNTLSGFPRLDVPPDMRRIVKKNGGFPKNLRKELEQSFPGGSGMLCKLLIDTAEECILKDLPSDQYEKVLERKMANLSMFEKLKLMAGMAMGGLPFGNDGDEDDAPTPSRKKQRKKR